MIITMSGQPGSGKSAVAKKLAEKLGYERIYIGQIRRDAAKKRGMTLEEYNKFGEENPETDIEVDEYQKQMGLEKDNFIIEGRTSWFLIPHSVKLFLKVEPRVGAERIFKELQHENDRNESNKTKTIEDIFQNNENRMLSDKYRYQKYYQKDCFDENNFDFVLDTTNLDQNQVFEEVFTFIEGKLNA